MHFLQLTEHQTLRIGQAGFTQEHWERCLRFREQTRLPIFQIGYRSLRWGQFVGVLQLGDLCIEVLPKVPQGQAVLVQMLCTAQRIEHYLPGESNLRLYKGLLSIYIAIFLQLMEDLYQKGLRRRYRREKGALRHWRGRLDLPQHLLHQATNREKFYLSYSCYDYQHPAHVLLYAALCSLRSAAAQTPWQLRLEQLIEQFPPQKDEDIRTLNLQQPIEPPTPDYEEPLRWARWIVSQQNPFVRAGDEQALSLLVDMNRLFEEYLHQVLQKALQGQPHWRIRRQPAYPFWEEKRARPDWVLECQGKRLVLDAKWKALSTPNPSDDDLRQLFAYQQLLGAKHGVLIYPHLEGLPADRKGQFVDLDQFTHLYFMDMDDPNRIQRLRDYLLSLDLEG